MSWRALMFYDRHPSDADLVPLPLGGYDPYGLLGHSLGPRLCRLAAFAAAVAWLTVRLLGLGLGPRL